MYALIVVSFMSLLTWIGCRWKYHDYYKKIGKIPSPGGNLVTIYSSIFWDMIVKKKSFSETFFTRTQEYSKQFEKDGMFSISLFPVPGHAITISSPTCFKDILTNKDNIMKNVTYTLLECMIGHRNLIMSDGAEWRHDRKIIDHNFVLSTVNSMNRVVKNGADDLIGHIKSMGGHVDDLLPLVSRIITSVILECSIGKQMDSNHNDLHDYLNGNKIFVETLVLRGFFPLFLIFPPLFFYTIGYSVDKSNRWIRKLISDAVDERIKKMETNGNDDWTSLSDELIRDHISNHGSMTKDVIVDHVRTFVFVGHKATSYTLVPILWLLASHGDKQKKLQEEIDAFIGGHGDSENFWQNLVAINNLDYLSAVIKEGHRLYPVSASIGRKVTKEFTCNGHQIPVGSHVMFNFTHLTRHPESFPYKPNDFIPERFIPGSEGFDEKRNLFSVIPFSHGLRKCIGERLGTNILKIFIIKLLSMYNISTTTREEDIVIVQDTMCYIKTPIDIKFEERAVDRNQNFV